MYAKRPMSALEMVMTRRRREENILIHLNRAHMKRNKIVLAGTLLSAGPRVPMSSSRASAFGEWYYSPPYWRCYGACHSTQIRFDFEVRALHRTKEVKTVVRTT